MDAARRPPDLTPSEQDVAAWMACLTPSAPPAGLAARVITAFDAAEGGARRTAWGRGGWGSRVAAAAALLAVSLGIQGFAAAAGRASDASRAPSPSAEAPTIRVVDDPCVPLFHGLETFGDLSEGGFLAAVGDRR